MFSSFSKTRSAFAFTTLFLAGIAPATADPNPQELAIASSMAADAQQSRLVLNYDPILAQVARARAADMAARNYFSHTNPDGVAANALVRNAGYPLPSWWGTTPASNYVESIAAGYATAAEAWQGWMNSSPHRTHLLGLDSFYAEETNYGIGFVNAPGSAYRYYWVVITAPPPDYWGAVVSQSAPVVMMSGNTYTASVTVKNTGANTWSANSIRLGSQNSPDNTTWGANRVALFGDVAPNATATLIFPVVAPPAGLQNFQWKMVQDGGAGWFGAAGPNSTIEVGKKSMFVSQSVPATMVRGRTYNVSVTMRNFGGIMWKPQTGFALSSQLPTDNSTWGLSRVPVPDLIPTGSTVTFNFTVTAPAIPGVYNFAWRMSRTPVITGVTSWFGELSPTVAVTVQ